MRRGARETLGGPVESLRARDGDDVVVGDGRDFKLCEVTTRRKYDLVFCRHQGLLLCNLVFDLSRGHGGVSVSANERGKGG